MIPLFAAAVLASACHAPQTTRRRATPPLTVATSDTAHVGAPRTVTGSLFDGLLTQDVLRGAVIALDGASKVTVTSDRGSFTFDSVIPGPHRIIVRHPLLDSLGIDTIGVAVRVPPGNASVNVSLPSPEAFVIRRCGEDRRHVGDGAVFGSVRQAESDEPIANADVAAAWRGVDTTYLGGGLRERARVKSDEQGHFLICRTPRFTPLELWVTTGTRKSARVRVQLGASMIGAYDFSIDTISLRDTLSRAIVGAGVITGRVLTTSGDGLPNVTVKLDRPAIQTLTDSLGVFTFARVPAGVRALEIKAIGFRPSLVGISLRPSQRVERDITLDKRVAILGTITVRASRSASWDSLGFDERRRRGGGYFFTQESLRGINDLSTALRLVPGISGRSNERGQRLTAGRGAGCFPAFVINGVRFSAGGGIGPEAMVQANDIRAMEVYTSRISTPPEHQRYGDCAVIVIWLRDPQREREAKKPRG